MYYYAEDNTYSFWSSQHLPPPTFCATPTQINSTNDRASGPSYDKPLTLLLDYMEKTPHFWSFCPVPMFRPLITPSGD